MPRLLDDFFADGASGDGSERHIDSFHNVPSGDFCGKLQELLDYSAEHSLGHFADRVSITVRFLRQLEGFHSCKREPALFGVLEGKRKIPDRNADFPLLETRVRGMSRRVQPHRTLQQPTQIRIPAQ